MVSRQQVTDEVVTRDGPAAAVTAVVLAVAPRLTALGLRPRDVLRVTDGRTVALGGQSGRAMRSARV